MKILVRALVAVGMLALTACGGDAQQASRMVISSDRELGDLAAALLPDLARRSGLTLKEPVRLEKRSRAQLTRYLAHKLDEELPGDEARRIVEAYSLLGLVPDTLDLRALLLSLYTEQVAGFYEPDSTALFILDDQPASIVQPLLVHELVHALQDQAADLDALTAPDVGNDRGTAAQAAIEGHATLVMLEYLTEQMRGTPVDLGKVPDFAATLRPALDGMGAQFPQLANAPEVIRQTLLFPYLEGAGFIQELWTEAGRVTPFGPRLPLSTEQILTRDRTDAPVRLTLTVEGGRVLHEDDLGRLELGVFLDALLGTGRSKLATGWGGDRYVMVEGPGGATGLALVVVWDDAAARDAFVTAVSAALDRLPAPATLEPRTVDGRAAAVLHVGLPPRVRVRAAVGR